MRALVAVRFARRSLGASAIKIINFDDSPAVKRIIFDDSP